jgi:hypothetical protein
MDGENMFLVFTNWLMDVSRTLPKAWPEQLPPVEEEQTEGFWMAACREEMRTRHTLSAKILAWGPEPDASSLEPIEGWLVGMRIQWALQLVDAASQKATDTDVTLEWLIDFAMVRSWETNGCQGFWLHAERAGQAHPEAPGWLRDLQ